MKISFSFRFLATIGNDSSVEIKNKKVFMENLLLVLIIFYMSVLLIPVL